MHRNDDGSWRCHCGHDMGTSDHCPHCGCEEWEGHCESRWDGNPESCDCRECERRTEQQDDDE